MSHCMNTFWCGVCLLDNVRSEVCVCSGCEPSGHHFHHLHDFRGEADLLKPHFLGYVSHNLLMIWVNGCMLEDNGDALDTVI